MEIPAELTGGVVLRRAAESDIGGIVALLADDDLGSQRERPDDLEPYRRAFAMIDADPAHLLVVGVEGDDMVATLQFTVLPGLARHGATRAQIEGVRVARSHQGRGLGHALFTWAIDVARRRDCSLVQLTTDRSRAAAHRFYADLGFVASHDGLKLQL